MSEAAVRTSDRMDGAWPVQPDCCVVESTLLCEGRRPLCDLMAPTAFVHRIVGASTSAEARKVAWADKTLWDEAFGCPSTGNFLLVSPVRVHLRALYRYLCNRTNGMHVLANQQHALRSISQVPQVQIACKPCRKFAGNIFSMPLCAIRGSGSYRLIVHPQYLGKARVGDSA